MIVCHGGETTNFGGVLINVGGKVTNIGGHVANIQGEVDNERVTICMHMLWQTFCMIRLQLVSLERFFFFALLNVLSACTALHTQGTVVNMGGHVNNNMGTVHNEKVSGDGSYRDQCHTCISCTCKLQKQNCRGKKCLQEERVFFRFFLCVMFDV
jgi:hypothetical protein